MESVSISENPPWPALEARWAAQSAPSEPPLYTHTDLVSLLLSAQNAVQAFEDAHQGLVDRVRAAHPVVMPDLPSVGSFFTDNNNNTEEGEDARGARKGTSNSHDDVTPVSLLQELYTNSICKIQAPMVRCSRPAFRKVCRLWGTDISYTHMVLADSFTRAPAARHADFALYDGEDRLVVQLAAKSGPTAAAAARLLAPYCDAIDLNCGCPQRWAMREGLGSALLETPELVADMVKCVRNSIPSMHAHADSRSPVNGGFPCVVKMRVSDDIRRSVDFARQCVAAGASWLTVHGRTPQCAPSATVRWEAIRLIREVVARDSSGAVPVVVNGGVNTPTETLEAALGCGVGSVMVANGLLDNPAMFYSPAGDAPPLTFVPRGLPSPIASVIQGESAPDGDAPLHKSSFALSSSASVSSLPSLVALPSVSVTPLEVVSDFARAAVATDLMFPTTVQQVLRMSRVYLSPAERVHMAMLRSNMSVLSTLQELGLYVEDGRYPLNC